MILALTAIVIGLVVLVWSADRFVDGAASTARHFGVSPLLIGMFIVGFGTSAPELVVSAIAASQGNPGLALGNAYGSNITNIALILGLTALIRPIMVNSTIVRKQLPILTFVTALAAFQLWDGFLSRIDAMVLLGVFATLVGWILLENVRRKTDSLAIEMEQTLKGKEIPLTQALFRLLAGLVIVVLSSRILVWGAVDLARYFGISDLIIGLTVVAVGTSLPELASSLIAIRKGEHDIALGNVLGSNLFNTLVVVGIAGLVRPMTIIPEVLSRDILVMGVLTLSLFVIAGSIRKQGRINRLEGGVLLICFIAYTTILIMSAFSGR